MRFPRFLSRRESDEHNNGFNVVRPRRTRSFSTVNFTMKKTLGWKMRDFVGKLETELGPHLKKIFPNFVVVHYFYTITMTIIGSILLYPIKNMEYIDALFFAACSSTQAGLNTLDLNTVTLYQQIVMYVICCLTTPIFIHGSLAFLRLYWFERYFDNIRETSKLNFKMRRTATLAARTQSVDRQRTLDSLGRRRRGASEPQLRDPNFQRPLEEVLTHDNYNESPESKENNETSSSDVPDLSLLKYTQSAADVYHMNQNGTGRVSEPSDSDQEVDEEYDEEEGVAHRRHGEQPEAGSEDITSQVNRNESADKDADQGDDSEFNQSTNIKFADLPKPRREDVEPRDVYMSISMLRDNQLRKPKTDDEDDGPALIIKGPAEREKLKKKSDEKQKSKNSSIHFDIKPKNPLNNRKRSGIRRSFVFQKLHNDNNDNDDNDEEGEEEKPAKQLSNDINNTEDLDDLELQRAQSNLQLPSSDQSGGVKFSKRSNTLDVPSKETKNLIKSPTFDKFVKKKLKKPAMQFRRRLSSNAIQDDEPQIDHSDFDSETDDDHDYDDSLNPNDLRRQMSGNYLSWDPQIARNSKFINLSDQQKEELGGVEYRAVKLLSIILVSYYVGFHIIGFLFFVPWILKSETYAAIVRPFSFSVTWWGFFTSMSSFNDLGFTLTPNSMISFNKSPFALLVSAVLIIIGNTGFPILLRFIIWLMFKLSRDLSLLKESLGFLLDHPRRCFTLLFPSAPTWWLLFILVVLNVIDLILFIVLDVNSAVLDGLTAGQKVLDGIYQAVSTRTAGFACVDLSQLHPSVQVSYMVMMYISVLPLAISIRRTNVYEEQSLGVYMGKHEDDMDHDKSKPTSFIGAHLRKQLSFDLWFVFLGLFIICIAEGDKLKDNNLPSFNVFSVMFEVVSAYGTVGLSLGYPNTNASFSSQFNVVSKLVIIAMVIRGRMRGLPYSLDRSIILPSARMDRFDRLQDIQASHTIQPSETIGSHNDPVLEFFKSAAPRVIRKSIRRPSFFRQRSSAPFNYAPYENNANVGTSGIHFQPQMKDNEGQSYDTDNLNHIPTNYSDGISSQNQATTFTQDQSDGNSISPTRTQEYEMEDYFERRLPDQHSI